MKDKYWTALCGKCGIISEQPNGAWVEAEGRLHLKLNPEHETVVVGLRVEAA